MSLSKSMQDDLNRELSPSEPGYGEDLYDDGDWPSEQEVEDDTEYQA